MPRFAYEVRKESGRTERGTAQGANEEAVRRQLRAQGYMVVTIEAVTARVAGPETPREMFARRVLAPVFYPVNSKALAMFFASVRVLVSAGMSVSEAMGTLSQQTGNPTLQKAAEEMREAAIGGRPMSQVLGRYPSAFSPATVAVMEAGEESGLIERTLERLTKYFDRSYEMEQMYRWQTFYPKLMLIGLVVLPTVPALLLHGFQPWLMLVLARALPLALGLVLVWYGWRLLRRIESFSQTIDRIKLGMPWFGSLARRTATARWARALAMLMEAGVPVHRSLVAAAAASGNKGLEASLAGEAEGVLHGKTLTEVVRASNAVPRLATDMLATAEKSGSVEGALEKLADYFESETDVGGKQTAMSVGLGLYLLVAAAIGYVVVTSWMSYAQGYSAMIE